jgi:small ligand-binding sensory domain FIST
VLPAEAITVLRATVAQVEVANLVGNAADNAMARLMRRRPLAPVALARELATVGAALPVAVPLFATAAAMRMIDRLAPPRPALELPAADDANLLAHLLSQALPTYCSNALVRLATLGLPAPLVVGIRSGRSAATVRISRHAVVVENDIAADADLVVDGDVVPLLRFATISLTHELTAIDLPDAP